MSIGTDISFFFSPKSIAVVGASPTPGKPSHVILENLKRIGYPGAIYLVNPNYASINGSKCYRSLNEIQDNVDVAIFVLPAPTVIEIMERTENVKGVIIVSAGFKETGYAGTKLEKELKRILIDFGF